MEGQNQDQGLMEGQGAVAVADWNAGLQNGGGTKGEEWDINTSPMFTDQQEESINKLQQHLGNLVRADSVVHAHKNGQEGAWQSFK